MLLIHELFCQPKNCFVTPYTILETPTRCSISYRFRGSRSLITPHLFPISNYASASPFWKSTGSYRFPNMHIEGRLNEGRGFNESIKTETKQNKTHVTPEKDNMSSANQTPGGYKFASLVASQQGRANRHEPAWFGLSSPWSFPSRSGIPLHAVVQPWLSLQRSISP